MPARFAAWSEPLRTSVVDAFGSPTHWTMEQGRSAWREPVDGDEWSRTVVRLDDERPVAVASAFHPALHPTREWCYVEVAPAHRGRGHGTDALGELRRVLPATAGPLRSRVRSLSAAHRFATREGFESLQRTRLVRVFAAEHARPQHDRRCVVVGLGAALEDEIVQAWIDYYTAGHDWDPPGALTLSLCRGVFFTGDYCAVLAIDRRRIVGVALVATAVTGTTTFTGGAVSRGGAEAPEIASELLGAASHLVHGPLHVVVDDWMWELDRAVTAARGETIDEAHIVVEPARP